MCAFIELHAKADSGILEVSNFDSIFHGHLEWLTLDITDQIDLELIDSNVLATFLGDLWECLDDVS
jgi:hypothetical protein